MIATKLPDIILITAEHILDGQFVLETSCEDYNRYKQLPDAVSYKGIVCTKRGWNSDRGYCCYKQGGMIADKVKK